MSFEGRHNLCHEMIDIGITLMLPASLAVLKATSKTKTEVLIAEPQF